MAARIRLFLRWLWGEPEDCSGDSGFAAVDAMVALVIISTTIILSLGAVELGHKASVKALEIRKAVALLQGLLETKPPQIGALSGTANGFEWRLVTSLSAGSAPSSSTKLCDRVVQGVSRATGRRYALSTTQICAVEGAR